MRNVMRGLICSLVLISCVGIGSLLTFNVQTTLADATQQSAPKPLVQIKETVDNVIKVVSELPGENNRAKRRETLMGVIRQRFDFEEMAKRSLGKHWKDCTPEEQSQFTAVFSDLLANTYLGRIESVKANTVLFDSERVEDQKALVKTTVNHDGKEFPLDYKLIFRDNLKGWMVYDVIIENIGLVENYRGEFDGIIRKEEFSGLMKKLREKKQ